MLKNKKLIYIFIGFGALAIAGLRFFYPDHKTESATELTVKPSQIDFSQSNHIKDSTKSNSTQTEVEQAPKATEQKSKIEDQLSDSDKKLFAVFNSILNSKSDNDPRLDSDLKKLSPPLSEALIEKYNALPPENRGGRGLITFLIARNFSTAKEADFLKKVFDETPCLSLSNCQATSESDPHSAGVDSTTLIYPQQAVLYTIEKQLAENPKRLDNSDYRASVTQIITEAEAYPISSVRNKAKSIKDKYGI